MTDPFWHERCASSVPGSALLLTLLALLALLALLLLLDLDGDGAAHIAWIRLDRRWRWWWWWWSVAIAGVEDSFGDTVGIAGQRYRLAVVDERGLDLGRARAGVGGEIKRGGAGHVWGSHARPVESLVPARIAQLARSSRDGGEDVDPRGG